MTTLADVKVKLAALNAAAREKLLPTLTTAAAQAMAAAEIVKERLTIFEPLLPYLARAFHIGFIPLVIFLGMRSEPRPRLSDLLTPM